MDAGPSDFADVVGDLAGDVVSETGDVLMSVGGACRTCRSVTSETPRAWWAARVERGRGRRGRRRQDVGGAANAVGGAVAAGAISGAANAVGGVFGNIGSVVGTIAEGTPCCAACAGCGPASRIWRPARSTKRFGDGPRASVDLKLALRSGGRRGRSCRRAGASYISGATGHVRPVAAPRPPVRHSCVDGQPDSHVSLLDRTSKTRRWSCISMTCWSRPCFPRLG